MKADRLIKLIERKCSKSGTWHKDQPVMPDAYILKLLRREQAYQLARVRRIVQEHEKRLRIRYALPGGIKYYVGVQVCIEILAAMNRRAT